jgi:RING finger/CHY zinc finger protein 1
MSCTHYDCGVDLLAHCCNEFFGCRFCHDTVKYEEEKDIKKQHKMNRHEVEVVRCRSCQITQPPSQTCSKCQALLGQYFCEVCKLFDNDLSKQIYHCSGCGICRIGPQSLYFHCETCNACLSISQRNSHQCRENALKNHCPICQEDLFTSRQNSIALRCGHYVHTNCQKEMIRNHMYKCPLCFKAIFDKDELQDHYNMLDAEIENTPMPEEYRGKLVSIICNECNSKCEVEFHIFGLKCKDCGSYNTAMIK